MKNIYEAEVLKTEQTLKPKSKPKKTKNEDYWRDNIIIVSAEQHVEMLQNETDEEEIDETFSIDDSLDTEESDTETSEAESGEICSDS